MVSAHVCCYKHLFSEAESVKFNKNCVPGRREISFLIFLRSGIIKENYQLSILCPIPLHVFLWEAVMGSYVLPQTEILRQWGINLQSLFYSFYLMSAVWSCHTFEHNFVMKH